VHELQQLRIGCGSSQGQLPRLLPKSDLGRQREHLPLLLRLRLRLLLLRLQLRLPLLLLGRRRGSLRRCGRARRAVCGGRGGRGERSAEAGGAAAGDGVAQAALDVARLVRRRVGPAER
jgi:hypothetical protein